MIGQLIIWGYTFFLLFGLGLLTINIIKLVFGVSTLVGRPGPVHIVFIGFFILHTLLGYISLFAPINGVAHIVIAVISFGALLFNYRSLNEIFLNVKYEVRKQPIYIIAPPLMFLVFIFSYSLYGFSHYDTGLYYLQYMQWIEEYPVVKGLAILHSRFGFNSHFLIDSSFFSLGFLDLMNGENHIKFYSLNSFLFFLLTCKIIFNLGRYFHLEKWYLFVVNILILYFSFLIMGKFLPNPSPDLVGVILIGYLVVYMLEKDDGKMGISQGAFIFLSLLVFTLVTIKISNAFLVLICFFYLYKFKIRGFFYLGLVGLVIMAPFLIRNVLLSGYLVYPLHSLDLFNFDWEVPKSWVRLSHGLIDRKALSNYCCTYYLWVFYQY
jgi:hypothetical protein